MFGFFLLLLLLLFWRWIHPIYIIERSSFLEIVLEQIMIFWVLLVYMYLCYKRPKQSLRVCVAISQFNSTLIYFGYRNGNTDTFGTNKVDEMYCLRCIIIYLISSTIVSFYFLSFFLFKKTHINVLCNMHFNMLCWCVDKKVRLFNSSFYAMRQ